MSGIERAALAFGAACDAAQVKYALVGGMAVAAWGEPRATQDIDALLLLAPPQVEPLTAALAARGLQVSAADFRDAIGEGGHVTIFDEASPFHVDAKLARTPEEREEVLRAETVTLASGTLRVVPPEETVAFKLAYGTPLDVQDARSILVRRAGRLDEDRLRDLARRLGVTESLERLRAEVESLDPRP